MKSIWSVFFFAPLLLACTWWNCPNGAKTPTEAAQRYLQKHFGAQDLQTLKYEERYLGASRCTGLYPDNYTFAVFAYQSDNSAYATLIVHCQDEIEIGGSRDTIRKTSEKICTVRDVDYDGSKLAKAVQTLCYHFR